MRLTVGVWNYSRFGRSRWLHGNGGCISGDAGFRFFPYAHQALIGDFPAEMSVLAPLLKILLEEDGTAGVCNKNAGSGQKNIASAILHFHTTPEKG